MDEWLNALGQLTGEEVFHLARKLAAACAMCLGEACQSRKGSRAQLRLLATGSEMAELRDDALMQVARVTVPMREAQQIVYRARFARGHPVRMHNSGR